MPKGAKKIVISEWQKQRVNIEEVIHEIIDEVRPRLHWSVIEFRAVERHVRIYCLDQPGLLTEQKQLASSKIRRLKEVTGTANRWENSDMGVVISQEDIINLKACYAMSLAHGDGWANMIAHNIKHNGLDFMLRGHGCRIYPKWWGFYPFFYDKIGLPDEISNLRSDQLSLIKPIVAGMVNMNWPPREDEDVKRVNKYIQCAYGDDHTAVPQKTREKLRELQTKIEDLIKNHGTQNALPAERIPEAPRDERKRSLSPSSSHEQQNSEDKRRRMDIARDDGSKNELKGIARDEVNREFEKLEDRLNEEMANAIDEYLDDRGNFPILHPQPFDGRLESIQPLVDGRILAQSDQLQHHHSILCYLLEQNQKIVEQHQKLVEQNQKIVEQHQNIVEQNRKIVEQNQKLSEQVEDISKHRVGLEKLRELINEAVAEQLQQHDLDLRNKDLAEKHYLLDLAQQDLFRAVDDCQGWCRVVDKEVKELREESMAIQPIQDLVRQLAITLANPDDRERVLDLALILLRQAASKDARGTKVTMNGAVYTVLNGSPGQVTYECDAVPGTQKTGRYYIANHWAWTRVEIGPAKGVGWPMWDTRETPNGLPKEAVPEGYYQDTWLIEHD